MVAWELSLMDETPPRLLTIDAPSITPPSLCQAEIKSAVGWEKDRRRSLMF